MPNIIIKNEAGEDVTYNNVNTVRFQTDESTVASYHYLSGEKEKVPDVYDYEVIFYDDFGNEIQHNYVDEGDSVEVPTYEREGFIFHGWAHVGDFSSVDRDILVMPITEKEIESEPITVDAADIGIDYDYFDIYVRQDSRYVNQAINLFVSGSTESATFEIAWGDGSTQSVTVTSTSDTSYSYNHTFAVKGGYTIAVKQTSGSRMWGSAIGYCPDTWFCINKAVLHSGWKYNISSYNNCRVFYGNYNSEYYGHIKKLIINSGADIFGYNNYSFCTYMTIDEVYFADGVSIGDYVFSSCQIGTMRLPSDLVTTGAMFGYSYSIRTSRLNQVYIPDTVTSLPWNSVAIYDIRFPKTNALSFNSGVHFCGDYVYVPENITLTWDSYSTVASGSIATTILCPITGYYYNSSKIKFIATQVSGTGDLVASNDTCGTKMAHINFLDSVGSRSYSRFEYIQYLSIDGYPYDYYTSTHYRRNISRIAAGDRCKYIITPYSGLMEHVGLPSSFSELSIGYQLFRSTKVQKYKGPNKFKFSSAHINSEYGIRYMALPINEIEIDATSRNETSGCYLLEGLNYKKIIFHGNTYQYDFSGTVCDELIIKDATTFYPSYSSYMVSVSKVCDICDTVTVINGSFGDYLRWCNVDVYCRPTTPPTLSSSTSIPFRYINSVHVPADSLEAYQTATNWSAYSYKIIGDL